MYILVAGAGEMGRQLARLLRSEGHDIVLIERDALAAEKSQSLDVLTVEGNASSPRVLERANVERADLLFALTQDDEVNLMACALARTRGVRTVARLNSLEYMDSPVSDAFKAIGAEVAVSIEMLGAIKLARLLAAPAFASVDDLAEGRLLLLEMLLPKGSPATSLPPREARLAPGSSLLAFVRGEEVHFPTTTSATLAPGDRLLILARDNVPLDRVAKPLLPPNHEVPLPPKRVMIAGATTIGLYLARLLAAEGAKVRVVDADGEAVRRATLEVEEALVVRGSVTDRSFLEEENIAGFDAFVSVTEDEPLNILAALMSKQLGTPRALATVRQRALTDLAERMGVDAAPSPRLDGLAALYRFAHPLDPKGLVFLSRGDAQVMEVVAREGAKCVGRPARELLSGRQGAVGAIYRAGEALFPGEEKEIRPGDHVVMLVKTGFVNELKRWF